MLIRLGTSWADAGCQNLRPIEEVRTDLAEVAEVEEIVAPDLGDGLGNAERPGSLRWHQAEKVMLDAREKRLRVALLEGKLLHADDFAPMAHESTSMLISFFEQGFSALAEKLDGAPAAEILTALRRNSEDAKRLLRDWVDSAEKELTAKGAYKLDDSRI